METFLLNGWCWRTKRPFIRKTAFGPIPRQMVFKQTIEEDIVGSTGAVKGGRAPPLRLIEGRRAASERRIVGESGEGDEERRLAAQALP
jgi:hypothetical protein